MRIAIGTIAHETSTLAPTPTTLHDFETGEGLFRGPQVLDRFRGTNVATGGFIDGAAAHGFEPVPLLWASAYTGGLIERAAYDQLKAELLDRLRAAGRQAPVDGALLDLHGSMVVESIDDGDADLLEAVRGVLGPDRPVIATTDLHANHTLRRVAAATAIVGLDTYPHVDQAERGREAADILVWTLHGRIRPVMALRQLPLFWGTSRQATSHPPMNEVVRRLHALEQRPGVVSVTVATGYYWADVPQVGSSVLAVADDDPALAQATADELGDWIWENRERWYAPNLSVPDALAQGERAGRYPIVLADQADNTGGGAPGDSTEILRTFLELGMRDALILYMVDAEVAAQAHAAGVGGRIAVRLGGKSHTLQGSPVAMNAEVVALTQGAFKYDGPMYAGLTGNMGPSAWLRQEGVSAVVVTAREQPYDTAFARTLGIDCAATRYLAIKSAVHFRSGFEALAGSIYNVDAQAIHTHDFRKLPYTRKTRPVFPLEIPPREPAAPH
jgi:microcystin degradation protein MlrC